MSAPKYWWFQGASVRELYTLLTEYGPDTARLEVHPHEGKILLRVKSASGEDPGPINESHPCPPFC